MEVGDNFVNNFTGDQRMKVHKAREPSRQFNTQLASSYSDINFERKKMLQSLNDSIIARFTGDPQKFAHDKKTVNREMNRVGNGFTERPEKVLLQDETSGDNFIRKFTGDHRKVLHDERTQSRSARAPKMDLYAQNKDYDFMEK